jgi:hypothetical protein
LNRSDKSDAELVREELKELKREKVALMRDTKLFQHYFFSFWREKARDSLLERDYLLEQIISSPQNLFNMVDSLAFSDDDASMSTSTPNTTLLSCPQAPLASSSTSCYLGFRQPLAFLYHTGNCRTEESTLKVQNEWFEVFIAGKSFPHHLAHVSSKVARKVCGEEGDEVKWFLHRVDMQVVSGQHYKVHTPKMFN